MWPRDQHRHRVTIRIYEEILAWRSGNTSLGKLPYEMMQYAYKIDMLLEGS